MSRSASLCPVALRDSRLPFVVDNMPATEIRPSPVHGNGLFALRNLAAGEVLGQLDGQRVDWKSHDLMRELRPYGACNADLFLEWNALSPDTLLIRPFRTKYSFINHGRGPNVEVAHDPMRVVVTRDVRVDDELLLDYRREPLSEAYLEKAHFL